MCTLIVLHRCVPGRPLVVAANRDEFLARPAEGPALRMRDSGPILSPLDLEGGGTWLGLNAHGLFVGLTNLRPQEQGMGSGRAGAEADIDIEVDEVGPSPDAILASAPIGKPGARSRGEVVMAALDARSAGEAASLAAKLEANTYNPFQLLVADSAQAWLTVYRDRPRTWTLEPGVHVVGNVEEERIAAVCGAAGGNASDATGGATGQGNSERPRARKLTRIRERVEKLLTERNRDLLEDLGEVCREHVDHVDVDLDVVEENAFESTCVHVADRYGTRSSLLLELAEESIESRLWATDGPPCQRSFEDLSALLRQLAAKSRRLH